MFSYFFLLMVVILVPAFPSQTPAPASFVAPSPLTAKESLFPVDSVASGPVHLVVQIDSDGKVGDVKVVRSIPSLDEPSIRAAKQWKFVPAQMSDQPHASFFSISFNYYLPSLMGEAKMQSFSPETRSGVSYTPPIPVSAPQPRYPDNSVAWGSVILVVDVTIDGTVSKASILKPLASLNELCIETARQWRYEPAKLNGQPINAKAAICFNFDRGNGLGLPP
jgi:TonB family protein